MFELCYKFLQNNVEQLIGWKRPTISNKMKSKANISFGVFFRAFLAKTLTVNQIAYKNYLKFFIKLTYRTHS